MSETTGAADGAAVVLADILAEVRAGRERSLLLPAADAAALVGMSRSVFYRQVSAGKLPPAVATPSGSRWRRADLERWVEKLKPRR